MTRYVFIVNGREDKKRALDDIKERLEPFAGKIVYDIYVTTCPGDATRYVSLYCDLHENQPTCFVACGGDGTINEVASGLMGASEDKSMAVLAYGTGNDFVKYYPGRDFNDLGALLDGEEHSIDILRVNDRFSINVCNFGFDSIVASTANRLSVKGFKKPFRLGIVAAILSGRFNRISVSADGESLGGKKMLLCTLANCQYVGGEFFCAPKAKNDDGLIDVCLLRTMSLMKFLQILPVYTKGEHLDSPNFKDKIVFRKAKTVHVEAPKTIELCIDGEMISGKSFNVSVEPKAINLIVPAQKNN